MLSRYSPAIRRIQCVSPSHSNSNSQPSRCVSHSELPSPGFRRYDKWHLHKGPGRPNYPRITPNRILGADYNLQERLDQMYAEENARRANRRDVGIGDKKNKRNWHQLW